MTYKGIQIDKPTIEMVQEYIDRMKFKNLSAFKIFNHYNSNGWRTAKGTPIVSIETAINACNSVVNPGSGKKKIEKTYNSEKYKDLLLTEEWKVFRDKVKELHGYKCDICGSTENLNVHHKAYRRIGAKKELTLPWAYFFEEMQLLCKKHHDEAHEAKYYNKV